MSKVIWLYADDFIDGDVWQDICDHLGVHSDAIKVRIEYESVTGYERDGGNNEDN